MAHDARPSAEKPLQGVVLCCTALAQEIRTKLADAAVQMGAVHKLDLTSDVTHLVVGSTDTPKYRYVAKERPDICALGPEFIEAAREAWMAGDEMDVEALQKEHTLPALFGLKLCVTGFDDQHVRRQLEENIRDNGASYTGDLVKQVTHLIAARPEGAKYTHARQWGIKVVGLKWLQDSLKRGMALDENCYMPETPIERQGVGAYRTQPRKVNLAKRGREVEPAAAAEKDGPRKMRRTASRRLEGHSQDLWKSVAEHEVQVDATELDAWNEESQTLRPESTVPQQPQDVEMVDAAQTEVLDRPTGLFAGLYVLIQGFDARKKNMLSCYLEPNGAVVVDGFDALEAATESAFFKSTVLLMPHATPTQIPSVPAGTILVTEWWLERCLHFKQYLDPQEDALSQPHANSLAPAFKNMTISTTGFDSVDLRQTAKVVELMGATYQEQLQSSTSILVSGSKNVKRDKAIYASKHHIPVVTIDWLWTSLRTKKKASVEQYRISLPAFDSSEYTGTPAASNLSPSNAPQPRAVADDFRPKRLSNTRKRYPTQSLLLKPSNESDTFKKPSEPSQLSKSRKREAGPFIMEDEDEDQESEPAVFLDDQPAFLETSNAVPTGLPKALREISPNNTSQPTMDKVAVTESLENAADEPAVVMPEQETMSPQHSPRRSPSKENENDVLPAQPMHKLKDDLADFLKLQAASSNSHPAAPAKRKARPLGRNLSSISNRSGSIAAAPSIPADVFEENSTADGFDHHKAVPALPPSTQLGYDTPEAEAHRMQMSKKMGTDVVQDEGVGKRVASVGTVKDSSSRSAVGGRVKGRTRTRP